MIKKIGFICLFFLFANSVKAQFTYGTTGLLHMPTSDMQQDKTFILGGSYLNEHAMPSNWYYNTWNYYINITFFPWLEVAYTCNLFSAEHLGVDQYGYSGYTNQDRSFHGRLRVWKEGWWKEWTPQIVVGVNDFTTGSGEDYLNMGVEGNGNGYFNRYYIAATKHFQWNGEWGIHAAYVYNKRNKDKLNGMALGVNYQFDLPQSSVLNKAINGLNLMAEYDSQFINVGARYKIWKDHINIIGELRECKYPSVGMYFKVHLK
jgi:hypothetical protein